MAAVEHVHWVQHRCEIVDGKVVYVAQRNRRETRGLPQIFWDDHSPWIEANLWAVDRISRESVAIETVESNLRGLADYATFLEEQDLKWSFFPARKEDRCIVRYRGALIKERNDGTISPSTATMRMRHVVHFYRWAQLRGLCQPSSPIWRDRVVYIKYFDPIGFERTLSRLTTDLAIPNRPRPGERLEDGLLPVSAADRDAILAFARERASPELFLILAIGFFVGLRLGSICDLRVETLHHAVPDPAAHGLYRVAVGPGASPPVHTKFSITGQVWISQALLGELLEYAGDVRRLKREAKASRDDKNLVFLTRFGNSFGRRGSDRSAAVNVEMSSLRHAGVMGGLGVLRHFHMHQTRCTFATELARLAVAAGGALNAVAIVKDALLHKDEATTLRYIRFLQNNSAKEAAASAFMTAFAGIVDHAGSTRRAHE